MTTNNLLTDAFIMLGILLILDGSTCLS